MPPGGDGVTARVRAHYACRADAYARHVAPVLRPARQSLLPHLPLEQARVVVDVGTGTGEFLGDLRHAAGDATVLGVDLSEPMLAVAHRDVGGPVAVMDGGRLALRDRCADVVVAVFMLFLFPRPLVALRELRRVLRPEGTFGVAVWGPKRFPAGDAVEAVLDEAGVPPDPLPVQRSDERMDRPHRLARLLADAGLEVAEVWSQRLAHHTDPEALLASRAALGTTARRLGALDERQRDDVLARVRERLSTLPDDAFVDRSEVVLGVARLVDEGAGARRQ